MSEEEGKKKGKDKGVQPKPTTKEEKIKRVQLAILQIEKEFGKGAIMKMGDQEHEKVDVIPSGCLVLDIATGIGGIPRGRITEIYGPESSGKTTVALHVIASAQKSGGTAAFIDAEHALDPTYAENLGVDLDELYVSQPDSGEQALDICEELIQSNAFDIVVIDSVAALAPKAELEGEMGDNFIGLQARLMSQALRKLAGIISKSNTCVIFINQLRDKVGVMFGSPETTAGGKALKFYSSIRLDVRRVDFIKDGSEIIGNRTRIKIIKNKIASPYKSADFDIIYGKGVSNTGCILDLGVECGLVEKSGAWFAYNGEKIGQGKENAKNFLDRHPEIRDTIENGIKEYIDADRKYPIFSKKREDKVKQDNKEEDKKEKSKKDNKTVDISLETKKDENKKDTEADKNEKEILKEE